jgi:hypothetical protein
MSSQTSSASSTTDSTYDYQADGVHLVDLTTTTQTSFGPTTLRFHPTPPPLTALARPSPGATIGPFDMTSDDGKTIATVKITVESTNDTMKSGDGADHQTARMQLDTTLRCASGQSCPFTGTLNSTNWLGYDGLTIKSHSVTDGHFGNIAVKSDVTSVVDRATPA